ncbi:MAG: GNAT family N-acetyltransferase [Chitinophagaceae bacterium]|nr:GNAT family N-acetyltransferase [Chitinophagaceae bacterium]MCW5905663.1 GNAT family N-acetyltransferase [Chitinophagaceae bacterium]
MRKYLCLQKNEFQFKSYKLVPIRDEDKYVIMQWRNEQIDILRQKQLLTKEHQENYFSTVVTNLFKQEKPQQILFSFLENDTLIAYGGLVHIDWESKNAEISFLLSTELNNQINIFKHKWDIYLKMLTGIAFNELEFHKIYTYAYDIRDYYFEVMYKQNFFKEAHLKEHILINNRLVDILILSKMNNG